MDSRPKFTEFSDGMLQELIKNITKFKLDYFNDKDECKRLRDVNNKLEIELKSVHELEKSHCFHLLSAREMIGNLQETVSHLLYLKRDFKKLKDEIKSKDANITMLEKEKEHIIQQNDEIISDLGNKNNRQIEELTAIYDNKVQQVQYESETQIANCNCVIEELRGKIREIEIEHKDKVNILVLEYEEKLQRSAAHVVQLQEQLSRQTAQTDANIDAYRRKLGDLEEKIKQIQFKSYLAESSYPSQYDIVERPYSAAKYPNSEINNDDRATLSSPKNLTPMLGPSYSNKIQKPKPLQILYTENKTHVPKTNERKGHFNITKKRKLYNEKDYLNN